MEENNVAVANTSAGERISKRNLIMFPLGTVGRDFLYQLFNGYLLSFILFTKNLTPAQFASVSIIIVVARIFDAFNDPIMGGIVENTRTKIGKFKPWMVIGALLTAVVVACVFSVPLSGWNFIAFLAVMYLAFSITFTMNDISYWGMLPSLATNEFDRNQLTSFTQIAAGIGGGLAGIIIPAFTSNWAKYLGGDAVHAYSYISIIVVILMVGFQMFTVFGVKEKPLPPIEKKAEAIKLKDMFKIIFKNDQLMWSALIMLIFNVGTGVVGAGLSMTYIYFEFGYNGFLTTVFGIIYAVVNALYMLAFPWLCKKFGRNKLIAATAISEMIGYSIMLIFGLALPSDPWYLKFGFLMLGNGFVGFGQGFYMLMIVNIANTVEYNEAKTGRRDEGLIFSIRPFTAKMGSALQQFLVMLIYLVVGVTSITNQISDVENSAASGAITGEMRDSQIANILNNVPGGKKIALLCCMCVIPIVFMIVALIVYKKKFFIDEKYHEKLLAEIAARHAEEGDNSDNSDNSDSEEFSDEYFDGAEYADETAANEDEEEYIDET